MSTRTHAARSYRARPRPRPRGQSRRPRSRIDWERAGRIALVLIFIAVLCSYVGPAIKLAGTWRGAQQERENLRELQRENAELKQRAASVGDFATVEREARKLGMARPDERPYVIQGLPDG